MKAVLFFSMCFASTALRGEAEPVFRVELSKARDGVGLYSTAAAEVVSLTSASGIGGARLVRTGARWPSQIIIQLRLRGLESFWMHNGMLHFETSLRGPRLVPYSKMDRSGNPSTAREGTLEVAIAQREGILEIRVPGELLAANPTSLSLGWIDFYRR